MWISDAHGRDIGIVGENREVSYSCLVEPSYIGSVFSLIPRTMFWISFIIFKVEHGICSWLQSKYMVMVMISADHEEVTLSIDKQCGWLDCSEAKAWREPGRSVFQCVFLPYQPVKLYAHMKETYQKSSSFKQKASKLHNGKLEFTMTAMVEGASGSEGSATAWFIGGFSVVDSLPNQVWSLR